jgi:hypothetical protein
MRLLPFERWRAALLDRLASGAGNALEPLLPLLYRERGIPTARLAPGFDCEPTLRRLAAAGIVAPPADRELFRACLGHLVRGEAPGTRSAGRTLPAGA